MRRLVALLLFSAFSAFVGISLLGYHAGDPSFNHRHSGEVQNWLGYSGSFTADLMLQIMGLSTIVLVAITAYWAWLGWRKHHSMLLSLRLIGLLGTLICTSMVLAFFTAPVSWPIATGLGGYLGFMLAHGWHQHSAGWLAGVVAAICGAGFAQLAVGRSWQGIYNHANQCAITAASSLGRLRARMQTYKSDTQDQRPNKAKKPRPQLEKQAPRSAPKIMKQAPSDTSAPANNKATKGQASMALAGGRDGKFVLPSSQLLSPADPKNKVNELSDSALKRNAEMLEAVLQDFGVRGEIGHIRPGPVVTLYELEPAPGTKSSRVIGLADDIARSMSAISARISVVPGRNVLGIELPNKKRQTVYLRELIESHSYTDSSLNLPMALGHDIGGEPCIADLAKMPHLLVAGTTGSGKSVGINAMILSLLYHYTPEQCRFIMVDPKMLELSVYDGIPHLLAPVVTEPGKAVVALKWAVKEMENRYRLMSNLGVRNISGYNQKIKEAAKKEQELTRRVQTGFDPETGKPIIEEIPLDMTPLPFIVVIVDEMADLMLVAGKDIEGSIQRLAQMARAAGIHMIMATQRPSVDVITGVIKANFPTRISFQVTSKIDSRTILGEMGAEQLLGMGDMLYMSGGSRITRVHGPFVDDNEVEEVVNFLKAQGEPDYIEGITEADDMDENASSDGMIADIGGGDGSEEDLLFQKAVEVVVRDDKASTSYVQRRLKIGYNRAATLIERMEDEGIISGPNHKGRREVLLGKENDE